MSSCVSQWADTISSSSGKQASVNERQLRAAALAYTPSQNCCSFSSVYETSNSMAQID